MKGWVWIVVLAGALVMIVGVEESRIMKLNQRIAGLEERLASEEAPTGESARIRKMGSSQSVASRTERPVPSGERSDEINDQDAENIGSTLRKMAENPASRAMMNQGLKAMTAMWYADLVDEFNLSKEEEEYFMNLIAGNLSEQQAVGMKMMNMKDEGELEALKEQMETGREDLKEAIKDFLNNDEDYAAYEAYEERMPERQQLEGLRAAMTAAEAPLMKEQENEVIEAMYRARKNAPGATDWSGAAGMEAIASGDAAERFEKEWDRTSGAVAVEVGKVVDEKQLEAFRGYQEQVKEMQMMGIKMAEKMFKSEGGAPGTE